MPNYNSTARMPFKHGGSVKKPKVKRIILWKGKAKDWPGAKEAARQTRNRKAEGGKARDYKKELAEWNSPENRKKRQQEYIKKHGPQKPKRKTLAVTDKYKKIREQRKFSEAGFKPLRAGKAKGGKAKDSVHQPTTHSWWLLNRNKRDKKAKGGKADKNWIQGVNKSIKKRGTKGVCTGKKFGSASCKPGSRRYNLAKTFKKMARSKHASGGLVRYI